MERNLFCGSDGPIRIFDTATWQQIATLEGHRNWVNTITLSQNGWHLLASASNGETARLWSLDTNLQVGPPLQHKERVQYAALSADGKVLVTGGDKDVYAWDIHAILKKAGLGKLLLHDAVAGKSPMNKDATRRPAIPAHRTPPRFFGDMQGDIHPCTSPGVDHPSSNRVLAASIGSLRALFARIPSLFRRPHSHTGNATELQQTQRQGIFSRHGSRTVDVAAVQDRKSLFVAPRPKREQQQNSQSHGQGSSSQSQPATTSTSTTQLAPNTNSGTQANRPGVPTVRSRLLTLLARLVLLICCAPLPNTDGH
ncbi:WD40-repeat-containing domain protein [Suillus subalutaceus]|uniref:WD40-repeat-containing domain protein n=1 Tax=Suillus subalutaceus TaxID=48586 RepID=UPI001B87BAFD|nr:WD40-repeat-containing domain protein [Suillus subalutaceus]KAG1836112.1 WD40-repeat-containing domain protein [Suillus subalutaceus]